MKNTIAALHISDSGIRILVGEIEGVFHSWYHDQVDAYMLHNGRIDLDAFRIRLNVAIEHAQRELHKIIDSWFLVYDVENVQLTSLNKFHFPNFYTTKDSINSIRHQIEAKAKKVPNKNIILTEPVRFRWEGRKGTIQSEVLPEIGKKLDNLEVDSIIYRTDDKKLKKMKRLAEDCGITVEGYIPSCFCYSHSLTNVMDKKLVAVVDIGNFTIKTMIFRNNTLLDYNIIKTGSANFTQLINNKYSIGNISKSLKIIRNNFSFSKVGDQNIEINSSYSQTKKKIVNLTRGRLRKEGRRVYHKFHCEINDYLNSRIAELASVSYIPVFVTGWLTNTSGYQSFLDKYFPNMKYLDISRVENVNNSFIALLGMMELIRLDINKSYCNINCVSNQNYNFLTWFGTKISKHTDKLSKIFVGG